MNEIFYPPSIQGAPPKLTVPNPAYRRQVVIVLLSLAVFILFYLGLVVGSGWVVVYGIMQGLNATPDELGHSDGNWVSALGRQLSHIEDRCRRLYFKSMGAILTRQEAMAQKYRDGAPYDIF